MYIIFLINSNKYYKMAFAIFFQEFFWLNIFCIVYIRTHYIRIDLKSSSYRRSSDVKVSIRCSLHYTDPTNQSHEKFSRCKFRQLRTLHLSAAAIDRLTRYWIGRSRQTTFYLRSASHYFRKTNWHFSERAF